MSTSCLTLPENNHHTGSTASMKKAEKRKRRTEDENCKRTSKKSMQDSDKAETLKKVENENEELIDGCGNSKKPCGEHITNSDSAEPLDIKSLVTIAKRLIKEEGGSCKVKKLRESLRINLGIKKVKSIIMKVRVSARSLIANWLMKTIHRFINKRQGYPQLKKIFKIYCYGWHEVI